MPVDQKVSELVAGSPAAAISDTDQFHIVQGGVSKGGLMSQLVTFIQSLKFDGGTVS